MSLSSTARKVIHNGNASATVFAYTFPILSASHLSVIYTDAAGVETTLSASLYSVTGMGSLTGGTVTYPLTGSPIAAGTKLTIVRTVPLTQLTTLSNQGGYYPEVVEQRLDLIYMALQQFDETISRFVAGSISDPATEQTNYTLIQALQAWQTGIDKLTTAGDTLTHTGSAYARLARGSAGQYLGVSGTALTWLNLDQRRAIADTNATAAATDRLIAFTSLTASRTVTLPAASSFNAGQRLVIVDESGSASQSIAISLVPNGSDTIAGSNTTQVVINIPRGRIEIESNGSSGWHVVGDWCVRYSSVLGADVSLNNTGSYFDTVSVAQGTVGTWRAMCKATVTSGGIANVNGKLWDGTTVIDSGRETVAGASQAHMITMLGDITAPAGNIKVSVNDSSRTDGTAKFNFSGNSKDTSLLVWRIA